MTPSSSHQPEDPKTPIPKDSETLPSDVPTPDDPRRADHGASDLIGTETAGSNINAYPEDYESATPAVQRQLNPSEGSSVTLPPDPPAGGNVDESGFIGGEVENPPIPFPAGRPSISEQSQPATPAGEDFGQPGSADRGPGGEAVGDPDVEDELDSAVEESFPASDPPSITPPEQRESEAGSSDLGLIADVLATEGVVDPDRPSPQASEVGVNEGFVNPGDPSLPQDDPGLTPEDIPSTQRGWQDEETLGSDDILSEPNLHGSSQGAPGDRQSDSTRSPQDPDDEPGTLRQDLRGV